MKKFQCNRRKFVGFGAALAAASGLQAVSAEEEMALVDDAGAQATALGYTHDAGTVDTAKYANFVEGSNCAGCQLYTGGDAEEGPCGIFPGKNVKASGWCSVWSKRAG